MTASSARDARYSANRPIPATMKPTTQRPTSGIAALPLCASPATLPRFGDIAQASLWLPARAPARLWRRGSRPAQRQFDAEGGATRARLDEPERAAVRDDDLASDHQAQARSVMVAGPGERKEQALANLRRNARAVVADVDGDPAIDPFGVDAHSCGSGLGGVQRQIAEYAEQLVAIAGDLRVQRRTVRRQQRRGAVARANGAVDVGQQVANIEHRLSPRWCRLAP